MPKEKSNIVFSMDFINRNDPSKVSESKSDYYSFSISLNGFRVAFWDHERTSIANTDSSDALPNVTTWDTREIVHCMGVLMQGECRLYHEHDIECKPAIMCCPCVMDSLKKYGSLSKIEKSIEDYIKLIDFEKKMEYGLFYCPTPSCPGVLCSKCVNSNGFACEKGGIVPEKWSCPLCTNNALPWPHQRRFNNDVDKDYEENPYVYTFYDKEEANSIMCQDMLEYHMPAITKKKIRYEDSLRAYKEDDDNDDGEEVIRDNESDEYQVVHIGTTDESISTDIVDEEDDENISGRQTPTLPTTPEFVPDSPPHIITPPSPTQQQHKQRIKVQEKPQEQYSDYAWLKKRKVKHNDNIDKEEGEKDEKTQLSDHEEIIHTKRKKRRTIIEDDDIHLENVEAEEKLQVMKGEKKEKKQIEDKPQIKKEIKKKKKHEKECFKCTVDGPQVKWRKWPHMIWGTYPTVCSKCYDKEVNSSIMEDYGKRKLRSGTKDKYEH